MKDQKKSRIIVSGIIVLLIGYGINQLVQSNKQKKQIIIHDMMIGVCAKNKASVNSNKYEKLLTLQDIKTALKSDQIFNNFFKQCEKEFKKSPKEFRTKWSSN
tara:strand:+ start:119 stop:427 length:309 start_codon:yes stop_codon:yes gene_type:complete